MTRYEVDFLILGDDQNVAKVNQFRIIVATMLRTLKKHAATYDLQMWADLGIYWQAFAGRYRQQQPKLTFHEGRIRRKFLHMKKNDEEY